MEYQKPMWNEKFNCWRVGDIKVPNWTPEQVKINKILGIKKGENMNENDTKIIVEQLEEKRRQLLLQIKSCMRASASVGKTLHDCLHEIDAIEAVLNKLADEDDEDDDDE